MTDRELMKNSFADHDEASIVDTSLVTLLYTDDKGRIYDQPLGDITSAGTLIDPVDGEDLELAASIVEPGPSDPEDGGLASDRTHPRFQDWQYEVGNGDTARGFRDWLSVNG